MATLTAEHFESLQHDGFAHVAGVFDEELDLRPVDAEFAEILDRLARDLHASGQIASTYESLSFEERFIRVSAEAPVSIMEHFEISLAQPHELRAIGEGAGIQRPRTPLRMNTGQATLNLLRSPRLLDLIEPLIGGEIYCNPVQHTRIKLPSAVGETLTPAQRATGLTDTTIWHQDGGVVLPEADRTFTVTVWIAMNDATIQNGCLVYARSSHRSGLAFHCPTTGKAKPGLAGSIPEEWVDLETAIPVPARRGDVLLHVPLTKHRSLANRSNGIRWSFDLRYHKTGEPTGRPLFPGFVARSRSDPASELRDAAAWRTLWEDARNRLMEMEKPSFNRWNVDSSIC
jgi:phytanoyl-CoA hydroxylase